MKKTRRSWWLMYAVCVGAGVGTLAWVSVLVLSMEADAREAEAIRERQESLRLALWRMDSWMAPRLAREAARPYFEYLPYFPQERAYTRLLNEIQPGEVLTPSPLLTFESDVFILHFQQSSAGVLTSPQAPSETMRTLAEGAGACTSVSIDHINQLLAELEPALSSREFMDQWRQAEWQLARYDLASREELNSASLKDGERLPPELQSEQSSSEITKSQIERNRRGYNTKIAQQAAIQEQQGNMDFLNRRADGEVSIGPFVSLWREGSGEQADLQLLLLRRLRVNGEESMQGILVDWSKLRLALRREIIDLFPESDVRLLPVREETVSADRLGQTLATIPVALEFSREKTASPAGFTLVRGVLWFTWMALGITVVAVGMTLHRSIAYGERRSRFATAVTHELRTPLTTFRLYSEMLADDMVRDEGQRREYLNTLKDESGRLAMLVENVLSYARLEEGQVIRNRTRMSAGELMNSHLPHLQRRAEIAGMGMRFEGTDEVEEFLVETDGEAVGQILMNLVDNACKYGRNGDDASMIEITVSVVEESLLIAVRDYGPGIDRKFSREVFVPFKRHESDSERGESGVGLGLALARGLARDLGGDLVCRGADEGVDSDGGACFVLTLPGMGGGNTL